MKRLVPCSIALALFAACASDPAGFDPDDVTDGVVVPDGKADDFFSLAAREYLVEGETTVTIEESLATADEATKLARVHELVSLKHLAIAWFLTQYLIDKEHDAENANYGGFGGMAKAGDYELLQITPVDGTTYRFRFKHLVAGRVDMIDGLPTRMGDDGKPHFTLTVGRPSNEDLARLETNREWYRDAPWSSWNPSMVDASQKEDLDLSIVRERDSVDAWFDYDALFADGKLTIDVHFGWDYHGEFHVKHAEALFNWLKNERQFAAPVTTFAALDRHSGPFTRTIRANGRDIAVEVRIFYGKDGSETDPDTDEGGMALEEDVRESLATRDVILYSGHSGPQYGFAMGNWRTTSEGDFDDSEMETATMPANRYQIVFANGCDTYQIGAAFRRNPAKPEGRFIDVITTTSFSNAGTPDTAKHFLDRLIEVDSYRRHQPRTLRSLVTDLDRSSGYWFTTMYGVHGIDDNPHRHPYANVERFGARCSRNSDCGGVGNLCIQVGAAKQCVFACTADDGCGGDAACRPIASAGANTIYASACVPR